MPQAGAGTGLGGLPRGARVGLAGEGARGRHDRAVMFCAPLRALIYIDPGGRTRFAAGQPGTVFAGFADQAIAELGAGLGHQFAELLKALGVGTTEGLRTAGLAGHRSVDANPPQPVRLRRDAGPPSL